MIIADENIDFRIIRELRNNNIEVFSIAEELRGIIDIEIIELAKKTDFIILTEDKDFGEWIFSHGIKGISVIFLRYHVKDLAAMLSAIVRILTDRVDELSGHFTTVSPKKIRRRKI
jgi:predicted nuclease of predicted toxin-antitoxin system